MPAAIARLKRILDVVPSQLCDVPEPESKIKPTPDRWSKIEILGHLIDSATNNHVRFVLAQLHDELVSPRYEQESWARVQQHQAASWPLFVDLWTKFNRHLCHVLAQVPPAKWQTVCRIGDYAPVTLEALAGDYVDHLEHHLRQILGDAAIKGRDQAQA
jgi:hypothetical protein